MDDLAFVLHLSFSFSKTLEFRLVVGLDSRYLPFKREYVHSRCLLQQYLLECVHINVEVKFASVAAAIISIHRIVNLRSHFGSSFLEFALFFRIRFVFLEFKNSSFLFEFADGGPASR